MLLELIVVHLVLLVDVNQMEIGGLLQLQVFINIVFVFVQTKKTFIDLMFLLFFLKKKL